MMLNEKEKVIEKKFILDLIKKAGLNYCPACGYNIFTGELQNFYPVYRIEYFKKEYKFGYEPEKDPQFLIIKCENCGATVSKCRLYQED